jgi:ketosteroid isomerase-like protein
MTSPTRVNRRDLPASIRHYLEAHAARDVDTAIQAFSPQAVVVDQGRTFLGSDQVREFLRNAGAEFDYTTELVDAQRVDDDHWVATNHLEGNFPGGVADLTYRFTTDGDRITELMISG